MNKLQTVATVAAAVVGISGSAAGAVYTLETRMESKYVQRSEYDDFQWAFYKREIRELLDRINVEENPDLRQRLEQDLRDTIDRFCRAYPSDRECNTTSS